jgi:hypothetical protein
MLPEQITSLGPAWSDLLDGFRSCLGECSLAGAAEGGANAKHETLNAKQWGRRH